MLPWLCARCGELLANVNPERPAELLWLHECPSGERVYNAWSIVVLSDLDQGEHRRQPLKKRVQPWRCGACNDRVLDVNRALPSELLQQHKCRPRVHVWNALKISLVGSAICSVKDNVLD